MRGGNDILHAEERVLARRFGLEHIKRGPGNMAVRQRRRQRQLVNQTAARAIDNPHPGPRPVQRIGRQNVAGLVGQRCMERDEVSGGQKIVKLDLFHADAARRFRRQERIIRNHLHLQPLRPVGYNRSDIAAADQT